MGGKLWLARWAEADWGGAKAGSGRSQRRGYTLQDWENLLAR